MFIAESVLLSYKDITGTCTYGSTTSSAIGPMRRLRHLMFATWMALRRAAEGTRSKLLRATAGESILPATTDDEETCPSPPAITGGGSRHALHFHSPSGTSRRPTHARW